MENRIPRWAVVPAAIAWLAAAFAPTPAWSGFIEEAQFGGGATIPVGWGDHDNDGNLDVAVGNHGSQNYLYINNGDGSFTQRADFGKLTTFAVAWADYDNDGDSDLAVGNGGLAPCYLYVNNGDGTFTQELQFESNKTNAVAWGDYDQDGDLDLAVGNGLLATAQQNRLYINNGDGSFTAQDQFGLDRSASLVWGDYDRDGDLDLAVGNGGFGYVAQNYLYINNGDGTFTGVPQFGMGDTACLDWGDFNNDGYLDMAVGNWATAPNLLYINNGDGTFTPQAWTQARDTNTLSWGDYDNDGDLDVAVGNGDFETADTNFIYINNGDGSFTETPEFGLGSTDAVAWGDYDNDGDLDLAAGNEHHPVTNYLYINQEDDGDYLYVRLTGHFHDLGAGYSNRDGIGAKVEIYEAGHLGESGHLLGFREVTAHGGFSSQDAMAAHFGLPGHLTVDIRITWPGSGGSRYVQDVTGVAVGQKITVEEEVPPASVPAGAEPPGLQEFLRVSPNPTEARAGIEVAALGGSLTGLKIYNVRGRHVRTLELTGPDEAGRYRAQWDGLTDDGSPAPTGLYLVRGVGAGKSPAGRVLLLR